MAMVTTAIRDGRRYPTMPVLRRFAAVCLLLVTAILVAGRSAPVDAQSLEEYRLGSGDRLGILIFGHADISGEFQIDGLGRISMPLLGQVDANGKTVAELQDLVTQMLDADFIVNPRVSIEVLNYRPFFIYGQVNKPGSYPFVSGMTVRQAVVLSGGFTKRAREAPVIVIRHDENGQQMRYDAYLDAPVLPGDTIEVERRFF